MDTEIRILQEISRYQREVATARRVLGAQYCLGGCVTICPPSQKREGVILSDTEGLELAYEATNEEAHWALDRTKRVWTFADMERFRRDSSYTPPEHQKEYVGTVAEFKYNSLETERLGEQIAQGQRVGPLQHEMLVNIPEEIAREIGIHMIAVGRFLKNKKR